MHRHDNREEEPEWFTGGPSSQSETIELRGFDDHREETVEEEEPAEEEVEEEAGQAEEEMDRGENLETVNPVDEKPRSSSG